MERKAPDKGKKEYYFKNISFFRNIIKKNNFIPIF